MSESKHTKLPWTDNLAPAIPAGSDQVLLGPRKERPLVNIRVLSEENFQFAKHRVNNHDQLVEALNNLIFTASKLWDEVKPIKDTPFVAVTHPIIEAAKYAINQAAKI